MTWGSVSLSVNLDVLGAFAVVRNTFSTLYRVPQAESNHFLIFSVSVNMVSLFERSGSFVAIVRKQPEHQVVFFPIANLKELSDMLVFSLADGLEREQDPTLPDSVYRIGKHQLRVTTFRDTCNVRVDLRLWYVDKEGEEKPTTRGVNINLEQTEILKELVDNHLEAKKKAAEEEEEEEENVLPTPPIKKVKKAPAKASTSQPKKTKAPPKKKPAKKVVVVAEESGETDEDSD